MPVFEYKGYDTAGAKAAGIIDADSPRSARTKLKQKGLLITTLAEDTGRRELLANPLKSLTDRISTKDVIVFTRHLATLSTGGLTLVESLDALIEQTLNVRFKKIVTGIREKVMQGSPLAGAMAEYPDQFDPLYVNLVRAGEASGSLDVTLNRLATFGEERLRQRSKVTAAMIYPAVMTLIGSGVLLYLLAYVTPKVQSMFEDMRQGLPMPTVILLFVSDILSKWWWALIGILIGLGIWIKRHLKTKEGKERFDTAILKLPVFGELARAAAIGRFARALSTLLKGGVPLIESLKVTGGVVGNTLIEKAIEGAIVNITEGQPIAAPLRRSGLFPPLVTQMIDAGERTGSLPDMLEKISDAYEFEVETALSAITSLVEPVLILVMGAVVGFIVMAILLPIFELSQVVK
ncbi:MAG: type II secretion system inner membrane protein GspF [Nitrospinae bacterium]|nr:type II secretion system inner membrane protein GspF [Nitrospinota bacterium]